MTSLKKPLHGKGARNVNNIAYIELKDYLVTKDLIPFYINQLISEKLKLQDRKT